MSKKKKPVQDIDTSSVPPSETTQIEQGVENLIHEREAKRRKTSKVKIVSIEDIDNSMKGKRKK